MTALHESLPDLGKALDDDDPAAWALVKATKQEYIDAERAENVRMAELAQFYPERYTKS